MTENVISFTSRKPLAVQLAEEQAVAEQEQRNLQERDEARIKLTLEMLDAIREQVAEDRLQDVVVIARDPETGLFMHDLVVHPDTPRSSTIFGLVGVLECLKLELSGAAAMAPTLTSAGEKIDPYEEMMNDEYPEGEEW